MISGAALLILLLTSACSPLFEAMDEILPILEESMIAAEETQAALDQSAPDPEETLVTEDLAEPTSTAAPKKKATATPRATKTPSAPADFGDFDYFVLALSWAPDFCASNDDPQQCALGRQLGFVLHGLWPQYNTGYPSSCTNEKLPAEVKKQFPGLFPNDKLYSHEWEKHGTCSGLSPVDYLSLSKQFKESVVVPPAYKKPQEPFRITTAQLKEAFIQTNPGFSTDNLAPNCSGSGRFLAEVYVCFAKDGSPAACGSDVLKSSAKSCAQKDYLVRNTR